MTIGKAEYARRRKRLMALMEPNSIAIIPSAKEQVRSRDTEYPFRQDSDFYYLSGFVEPQSVLVLIPEREHGEFVMFCLLKRQNHLGLVYHHVRPGWSCPLGHQNAS